MRAYTVYTCTDLAGAVLYIGYTASYRQRMYQHLQQSRWFGEVHRVERAEFPTMGAALAHEQAMIEAKQPPCNGTFTEEARRRARTRYADRAQLGPWSLPHALIARVDDEARTQRITKSQALLNLIDRGLQSPESEAA